jgi:hypothetical protein
MTYQLLDMSKHLWRLHVDDGLNILWVALDSSFRDEVAQQLAKVSHRSSSKLSAFVNLMMMSLT